MSAEDEHSTLKQFFRHLLAGAIAGCVSRTVTAPIDRIKVFVQVSKHPQNYQDLVRQLYKDGGVWSFWRGNWINVVKSAPKSSLRFAFYEQIKIGIKKEDELSIQERIIAGSVSGWLSQTLIYPLEVVKTKMTLRSTGQYEGIMHCFKKVYRTEGLKAFGNMYFCASNSRMVELGMREVVAQWFLFVFYRQRLLSNTADYHSSLWIGPGLLRNHETLRH